MNNVNADFLSKWFSGKSLVNAQAAIALLNESLTKTYWVNRGSTKVPAALRKANLLTKLAPKVGFDHPLSDLSSDVRYGQFERLAKRDFDSFVDDTGLAFVAECRAFAADMAPVIEAIEYLNEESETNKQMDTDFDAKNPIGQCACCFRVQKVKPDGTMFKHGFKRPGDGEIYNECEGFLFKPYRLPKGA